jgi:hypothetical protein
VFSVVVDCFAVLAVLSPCRDCGREKGLWFRYLFSNSLEHSICSCLAVFCSVILRKAISQNLISH